MSVSLLKRVFVFCLCTFTSLSVFAATTADKTADKGPLVNEPMGVGNVIQMLLGLTFIVVLIIGMAWFMRRMGSFQTSVAGELKVLGGMSVGQRERVVLVQAGEKQILIGVAPGRVNTLHVLEQPLSVSESAPHARRSGFAERLNAALRQKAGS